MSSWFNFDGHMCLETCPFRLDFPIYIFQLVPEDPLDFLGIYYAVPFFMSTFINVGLFPPHVSRFARVLPVIYLFKE
jgi:hypothetical protein